MVVDRTSGAIEHRTFNSITEYISSNDLLVLNDTKVIPARLFGRKYGGGASIEVLLDKRTGERTWEALARPAKRLSVGGIIEFERGFYAEVKDKLADGRLILYFASVGGFESALMKYGEIPLPPYIKPQTSDIQPQKLSERYQTVYAEKPGATAAPTAGLHFTGELLEQIPAEKAYVTLHTGYGTFAPVREDDITSHKMHSEVFEVSDAAFKAVKAAETGSGRIIAVGTTSVRVLEAVKEAGRGETDLFIYPGYEFKTVDALITNFHLPKSTLLMLVSAFAGMDLIRKAYAVAVKERYRFFSFGDAMLIK